MTADLTDTLDEWKVRDATRLHETVVYLGTGVAIVHTPECKHSGGGDARQTVSGMWVQMSLLEMQARMGSEGERLLGFCGHCTVERRAGGSR